MWQTPDERYPSDQIGPLLLQAGLVGSQVEKGPSGQAWLWNPTLTPPTGSSRSLMVKVLIVTLD